MKKDLWEYFFPLSEFFNELSFNFFKYKFLLKCLWFCFCVIELIEDLDSRKYGQLFTDYWKTKTGTELQQDSLLAIKVVIWLPIELNKIWNVRWTLNTEICWMAFHDFGSKNVSIELTEQ